jgi:predicted metal-binding membrane protein
MIAQAVQLERGLTLAALFVVTALGLYLSVKSGDMLMSPAIMMGPSAAYALVLFVMWWTMMLAMMLPSAAPAVLTYDALARKFTEQGRSAAPPLAFAAGYAAVWTLFSIAAVVLQLATRTVVPLTGMFAIASAGVGGTLLVAAGIYQLSPLKYACLRKCQLPLLFLARNWQSGYYGAMALGFRHGLYCLGCCWVLMGLLFYGGVMELNWIIGLAIYVAAEKLIPVGNRLSQLTGVALVGWGLWVLARTFV